MVFGNIFVYFKFRGQDTIDAQTRLLVYIVLSVVCASGTLMMLILPRVSKKIEPGQEEVPRGPLHEEFFKSVRLFKTRTPSTPLHVQLGILVVFATLGTCTFCIVEWANQRSPVVHATETDKID